MMIGVLIISSGLGYIAGVQETNKGTIEEILQKRWKASYDIVVKPVDSKSITEEVGLLEPNYQNGIAGGISFKQYELIKSMVDIEVAAPIAVLGNSRTGITFDEIRTAIKEPGVYKFTTEFMNDNGFKKEMKHKRSYYFTKGIWAPENGRLEGYDVYADWFNWFGILGTDTNQLTVAIDPIEENKLVGLEEAVYLDGKSRYFGDDRALITEGMDFTDNPEGTPVKFTGLPFLVSSEAFNTETYSYKIEKLNLAFENSDIANQTMKTVKLSGGETYLDTIKTNVVKTYNYDSKDAHRIFVGKLTGLDIETKKAFIPKKTDSFFSPLLRNRVTPLEYIVAESPFVEKWQHAYTIKPYIFEEFGERVYGYRNQVIYAEKDKDVPHIAPYFVGLFDPTKLNLSKDPLTELPMETYRPATGKLVLNKDGNPVNPPKSINNGGTPYSFLTSPPTLLTTLDAAKELLRYNPKMGEDMISVIRLKVAGVNDLSEASQEKLEKVANEIEAKTGLTAEITLGSSPQPVITKIPKVGPKESMGWIEQAWVKLGASFTIFTESKLGYSSMISIVILVAVVYVFSSNLVSFLARKKEFALLISIGWRNSQILKLLYTEALLLGTFAGILSGILAFISYMQSDVTIPILKYLIIGALGFFIYLIGAIWPAILARKIRPYEALRSGEMLKSSLRLLPVRGIVFMAFGHLIGKIKRNILAILSIMLPTALLLFFIFVTFRLKGILFTTWLGQYVSLEVGKAHYIAIGVALLVAILTTFQIMWQNVVERKGEIAILKAIGWKNNSIRSIILIEGILIGIVAGILGYIVGLSCIHFIYGQFPYQDFWLILAMIIPMIVGLLGSIVPAEMSVRIEPIQGMNGAPHYYSRNKFMA
jgi:hypothetical protein